MPRLRRSDKRRHEMTLEGFCARANMRAGHTGGRARCWGGGAGAPGASVALGHAPARGGDRALADAVGQSLGHGTRWSEARMPMRDVVTDLEQASERQEKLTLAALELGRA